MVGYRSMGGPTNRNPTSQGLYPYLTTKDRLEIRKLLKGGNIEMIKRILRDNGYTYDKLNVKYI